MTKIDKSVLDLSEDQKTDYFTPRSSPRLPASPRMSETAMCVLDTQAIFVVLRE